MAVEIKSGVDASLLTVDPTSKAARVTLFDATGVAVSALDRGAKATNQPGIPIMGVNDDSLRVLRCDRFGNLVSGFDTPLLWEPIEGATLNTFRWNNAVATTMTATQAAHTGITLNATAITSITTGIILQSYKQFIRMMNSPLRLKTRLRNTMVANQSGEWGFGIPPATATTAQVDNGAFWRFNTAGTVTPVLAFNGTDVVTGSDVSASLNSANHYTYDVIVEDDRVVFLVQQVDTGAIISEQTLRLPIAQSKMFATTHLAVFYRVRNSGSAPASAGQLFITEAMVIGLDVNVNKPWQHALSGNTLNCALNPTTFAQTANYANSAAPASATLSNTAAGYTTLGGQWQFAAVGSAETDFALFGFTVPVGYQLCVTNLHIEAYNMGAASATSPTLLQWGLGVNYSTINLSSGVGFRKAIGNMSLPIGAAIGAEFAKVLDVAFQEPLVTDSNRLFIVILKVANGTATASEIIRGQVDISGYFE